MPWVTFRTAAYLCFWLDRRGARTNLFFKCCFGAFHSHCLGFICFYICCHSGMKCWTFIPKMKGMFFQGFFTQGCWIFCHLWLLNGMRPIRILLPGVVLRGHTLERCHSLVDVKLEWEWTLGFICVCSLLHEGSWSLIDACKIVVPADAAETLISLLSAGESGRAHLDLLLSSNILWDSGARGLLILIQDPGSGLEGFMWLGLYG